MPGSTARPLVGDARRGLEGCRRASAPAGACRLDGDRAPPHGEWTRLVDAATASGSDVPATEGQVMVRTARPDRDVIVCAAGGFLQAS
jgi:hypothetical protein